MATSIQQNIHTFLDDIRRIIDAARTNAVRSVDFCRVQMYWQMGQRILEEEQQGKDRADYGSYLIKNLAKQLQPEYGSGFSVRQLERCRQFYRLYPIASALRSQLNWTQYKMLITISDPNKREYYELETVNNCWTAREMERQINSQLYERLLLSNDKEAVLAVARKERIPQSPLEIIKDPMYLEFLGLERKPAYYEKDLESAIITHLQHFLLELGQGFTFVARQKRILLEDDDFFCRSGVLQPPVEMFCSSGTEDRQTDASGFGTTTDVCQLLRPYGEAAGRKFNHRHLALYQQERHGSTHGSPQRQQDHIGQRIPALSAHTGTAD